MSRDIFIELKRHLNIVTVIGRHVELKQQTSEWWGLCPFHKEKTPSFKVNPEKQTFYCFGCNAKGDVIEFVEKIKNITTREAVAKLAQEAGIELPCRNKQNNSGQRSLRDGLYRVMQKAVAVYQDTLINCPEGGEGRRYLESRGISSSTYTKYKVGVAPDPNGSSGWQYLTKRFSGSELELAIQAGLIVRKDNKRCYDRFRNRVVIPVMDMSGQHVAFTGRTLDPDQPKYINTPDTHIFKKKEVLLGFCEHLPDLQKTRKILFEEGGFDFLATVEHGIQFCSAPMGTALTLGHLDLVLQRVPNITVIMAYDGDRAGVSAIHRTAPMIMEKEIDCVVVQLPPNHDPHSFLQNHGRSSFDQLINDAVPLVMFLASQVAKHEKERTPQSISKEVRELMGICRSVFQKKRMAEALSQELKIGIEEINRECGISSSLPIGKDNKEIPNIVLGQNQPSRRILSFFLHHPERFELLKKWDFYSHCNDEMSRYILSKLVEENGSLQFCKGGRWYPEVVRILAHSSIESQMLSITGADNEQKQLIKWLTTQEQQKKRKQNANKLVESLLLNTLPA